MRKLVIGVVALAFFGAGVAVGWIANAIRTHGRSNQSVSPKAQLVISLLPSELGPSLDGGEPTQAAELIIILAVDTQGELQR